MNRSLLAILALLGGCATAYQPTGLTGGFSETRLDENVWKVNFSGNAYISASKAADYALLRAAELCDDNDYDYLYVADMQSYAKVQAYTTPVRQNTTTTGTVNTQTYGNTTTGSFNAYSTTRQTGGQTYTMNKPRTDIVAVCSNVRSTDAAAAPLKAAFVRASISEKYGIEKEGSQ